MSNLYSTREALQTAVEVEAGQVVIEWRNVAALGELLYALTRGARTSAKREAYEVIRTHVNATFRADTPGVPEDEDFDLVRPYPEA